MPEPKTYKYLLVNYIVDQVSGLVLRYLQTDFRHAARKSVIRDSESPYSDVEVLSVSILQMRIGSGLDRSSPKHLLRCLMGCRTEKE